MLTWGSELVRICSCLYAEYVGSLLLQSMKNAARNRELAKVQRAKVEKAWEALRVEDSR